MKKQKNDISPIAQASLTLFVLLFVAGCGKSPRFTDEELADMPLAQRTGLPAPSGGFVLMVNGEAITADKIVVPLLEPFRSLATSTSPDQFKSMVKPEVERVILRKISDVLIYSKAKKKAGEQIEDALDNLAEAEVRRFVTSYDGDYSRAEQALKQMGTDWEGFKEEQKKMILCQSYVSSQLPKQKDGVTLVELKDCYNRVKTQFITPAVLKFQLIDIVPAKLKAADPNINQQKQAMDLAEDLLARLKAGEDFAELAKKYSHGYRAREGGLWKAVEPNNLVSPYDSLAVEAEKTQVGQIAGPIEVDGHIFIMKLLEKQPESITRFEDVQEQLKNKILDECQRKAIDEFIAKLTSQAAVGEKTAFMDFCIEEIYRRANQ